jgi:hypothetical protein
MIILKLILKTAWRECGLDSCGSGYELVAGPL